MLGLATGEFASQGGCQSGGGDWSKIIHAAKSGGGDVSPTPASHAGIPHIPGISTGEIALMITVLVVGIVALVVVHLWVSSVARFMLFDAVATGRYRLREGWKRWGSHGFRYFLFQLAFGAVALVIDIVVLGVPALILWRMGVFSAFKEHLGTFFSVLFLVLPVFMIVALAMAVFAVLVKDFAIPIIALEDITIPDAIRKLWEMVKANKGDYTIYILVKVGIVIVVGIGLTVINVIIALILMVPVAIIFAGAIIANPHMFENPVTIALLITLALFAFVPLLTVIGLVATPAVVFYESYVLHFFGSRYAPLWVFMHPEGVPSPPAPPLPSGHDHPPYDIVPPEPIG